MCPSPLWAAEMEVSFLDHLFHTRRGNLSLFLPKMDASMFFSLVHRGYATSSSNKEPELAPCIFTGFSRRGERTYSPWTLSYQVPAQAPRDGTVVTCHVRGI